MATFDPQPNLLSQSSYKYYKNIEGIKVSDVSFVEPVDASGKVNAACSVRI